MPFEHIRQPVISRRRFLRRVLMYMTYSLSILVFSLLLGMLGYHYIGELNWLDSFLNAAMILTGMGPVDRMTTSSGKVFAGFYALYSGIAFLTTATLLFAPLAHRFLHTLHLDQREQ